MRLSIITINLNNLDGLKKTIDSIMSQTWRDFEWIIVDGGSTDGSKNLIEQTAANPDSNISWWCSEKDKGIYNAMNKGISHAHGEYVIFMNSGDTFYEPITLMNVFKEDRYHSDVLYGDYLFVSDSKEEIRTSFADYRLSSLIVFGINHQSSFIRRSLFDVEQYDESLSIVSDWKLYLRWMLENRSFEKLALIICRFDGTGVSTQFLEKKQKEQKNVLKSIIPDCLVEDLLELENRKLLDLYYPEIPIIKNLLTERRLNRRIFAALIRILSFIKKIGL